ncbi:MAG: bifunctional glutamate N-acetyltransferase/amino-acid acetyltransferase ArgJ [Lachnospiraceae bacterium]|nr:bifunctional glutamate N-acetyltransferase/amino-acid acetyltransferase ArgJ [Lachnospiraceae bacterium]
MKVISGGVTEAKGFSAADTAAGIKYKERTDMAMIYSKEPCVVSGCFTSNVVKAAPVIWDKNIVETSDFAQAVVVNAGIANACTGEEGMSYCDKTADCTGETLGIPKEAVLVASTGVIGMQLPIDRICAGVKSLSEKLSDTTEAGHKAALAIMTTDTKEKEVAVTFEVNGKTVTVGGMCKGAGMIHPNMCTMLSFITTDANISKEMLDKALKSDVKDTYNMITVDGDTSTNDTLIVLANGLAENEKIDSENDAFKDFCEALHYVNETLAKKMAADGEGATKLFEAKVVNAKSKEDAKTLSRAIVSSNLSKAAIFGCDANFGRFLCAMGYSGAKFDQNDVELFFESKNGKIKVFDKGNPVVFDEDEAVNIMKTDAVTVYVDMHEGDSKATAWGCDLTYDYVKINADYRS